MYDSHRKMAYQDDIDRVIEWLLALKYDFTVPDVSEIPLHQDTDPPSPSEFHHLYISDAGFSYDEGNLTSKHISAILCLGDYPEPEEVLLIYRRLHIERKFIELADHYRANITPYLDEINDFIASSLRNGNVLVHCRAGMSRSVAACVYYLIKSGVCSRVIDALTHIKKYRPCAKPQPILIAQICAKIYNLKLTYLDGGWNLSE